MNSCYFGTIFLLFGLEFTICQKGCKNDGYFEQGHCVCPENYSGELCEVYTPCNEGKMTDEDDCDCSGTGYEGEKCELPMCIHGVRKENVCQCSLDYTGVFCQQPPCYNGYYDRNDGNRCICRRGWEGKTCDIKIFYKPTNGAMSGESKNTFLLAIGMGLCLGFVLILGIVAWLLKNCFKSHYYNEASTSAKATTSQAPDQDWQDALCGLC